MLKNLIFVDCEARGISPVSGTMTEFGAVHFPALSIYHGQLFESSPAPGNPAIPVAGKRLASDEEVATGFAEWLTVTCCGQRPTMVSDNPAFDFMWIATLFDRGGFEVNPLGHSARRISDFWAGLNQDWNNTQKWKQFRRTRHDHNPVHDAMGNVEAFQQVIQQMREGKFR